MHKFPLAPLPPATPNKHSSSSPNTHVNVENLKGWDANHEYGNKIESNQEQRPGYKGKGGLIGTVKLRGVSWARIVEVRIPV